jgi:enoyl-CoA hydratase/carnithine racemase
MSEADPSGEHHILVEVGDGIQTIRLNRLEKKNAITRAMYRRMAEALTEGDGDPAVRVHLLLGLPGVFSAGNDLADFVSVAAGGDVGQDVWDFLAALAAAEKPLVSAVDGIAVGVGATIHLHCDLTFATPRTVFRTPFIDLGLVPEAGSSLLAPRLMGHQRAFALLALGEGMTAEEALAAGLIYRVVSEREVEEAAREAATALAAKPPVALKIARDLIRGPREAILARIREEGDHFAARLRSPEAAQAFAAFMGRKKA